MPDLVLNQWKDMKGLNAPFPNKTSSIKDTQKLSSLSFPLVRDCVNMIRSHSKDASALTFGWQSCSETQCKAAPATEEYLLTQRCTVSCSRQTLTLTSVQQNLIKQYNTNHVLQDHMIVLCLSQQQIQYKSNIQTEKTTVSVSILGSWHWKQLFLVSHFHSLLSFYPRLMSPANRVISKMTVNPVSSPAFWIRKNTTLPR